MGIAATLIAEIAIANSRRSGYFPAMPEDDPVAGSLRDLVDMLDANLERIAQIKHRVAEIQRQRSDGMSYTEIVHAAKPPLLVQLITKNREMLDEHGARVRRAEALALHEEGMTMEEIAGRFGVTRQRVSTLLREARRARPTPSDSEGAEDRRARALTDRDPDISPAPADASGLTGLPNAPPLPRRAPQ